MMLVVLQLVFLINKNTNSQPPAIGTTDKQVKTTRNQTIVSLVETN